MKQKPILGTDFQIPGLKKIHTGKVRDVYEYIHDGCSYIFMVTTDRISAFDKVLPVGIPYKGIVLNKIASKFLDMAEENEIPTWKLNDIHPMVTVGLKAEPIKIEMIVREFLTGSLWRLYEKGEREICGIILEDGMKEFEMLHQILVTPTTKAESGHDQNISPEQIIQEGLASEEEYQEMDELAMKLFGIGSKFAYDRGLILVDTKYEFGKWGNSIILIDEIHTPDSSRYWHEDSYWTAKTPRSLDKEFVRQWLMEKGFSGDPEQVMPEMTDEFIKQVSDRYLELYSKIMGEELTGCDYSIEEIETAIRNFIVALNDMKNPDEIKGEEQQ